MPLRSCAWFFVLLLLHLIGITNIISIIFIYFSFIAITVTLLKVYNIVEGVQHVDLTHVHTAVITTIVW